MTHTHRNRWLLVRIVSVPRVAVWMGEKSFTSVRFEWSSPILLSEVHHAQPRKRKHQAPKNSPQRRARHTSILSPREDADAPERRTQDARPRELARAQPGTATNSDETHPRDRGQDRHPRRTRGAAPGATTGGPPWANRRRSV